MAEIKFKVNLKGVIIANKSKIKVEEKKFNGQIGKAKVVDQEIDI